MCKIVMCKDYVIKHPEKSFPVTSPPPDSGPSSPFALLPAEVLDMIVLYLDLEGVKNLVQVCPRVAAFAEANYIAQVQISCDSRVLTSKKRVLKVSCSQNLLELKSQFKALNLGFLKELSLRGNYYSGKGCRDTYVEILKQVLDMIRPNALQKLEILVHESQNIPVLEALLAKCTNLQEVSLIGHGREAQYAAPNSSFGAISTVVNKVKAKKLKIANFQTAPLADVRLVNPQVEELYLDLGKEFRVSEMKFPRLRKVEVAPEVMGCSCLAHADDGHFKNLVFSGCPNIESYNGIDLHNLPEKEKYSSWLENISAAPLVAFHNKFEDIMRYVWILGEDGRFVLCGLESLEAA